MVTLGGGVKEAGDKDAPDSVDRRKLIALAASAALGAAVVSLTGRAVASHTTGTGTSLVVGEVNQANTGDETRLDANTEDASGKVGLRVVNSGSTGRAIVASSKEGWGVSGVSNGGVGVEGVTIDGLGVSAEAKPGGKGFAFRALGRSEMTTDVDGAIALDIGSDGNVVPATPKDLWPHAIMARSPKGIAISANSDEGYGVIGGARFGVAGIEGWSETGMGVSGLGQGTGGRGVRGYASGLKSIAIHAQAVDPAQTGLRVDGRSIFSTAGLGIISKGFLSKFVSDPKLSGKSHVMVTLTKNPGVGRALWFVELQPGQGFTVHLSGPAADNTPFTYFIVEQP